MTEVKDTPTPQERTMTLNVERLQRLNNILFEVSNYSIDTVKRAIELSDYADYIAGLAPRLELLRQMIKEAANETLETTA